MTSLTFCHVCGTPCGMNTKLPRVPRRAVRRAGREAVPRRNVQDLILALVGVQWRPFPGRREAFEHRERARVLLPANLERQRPAERVPDARSLPRSKNEAALLVLHRRPSGRPICDSLVPEPSKAALGSAFNPCGDRNGESGSAYREAWLS